MMESTLFTDSFFSFKCILTQHICEGFVMDSIFFISMRCDEAGGGGWGPHSGRAHSIHSNAFNYKPYFHVSIVLTKDIWGSCAAGGKPLRAG